MKALNGKASIKLLINDILRIESLFLRRSKDIVVCGGWFGNRFADNSKAMFLFLHDNKEALNIKKVYYVTKNKEIYNLLNERGYACLMQNSLRGIWNKLRAKYHIVDQNGGADIGRLSSMHAVRVNLWHGFPLKRIGYSIKDYDKTVEEIIAKNNCNYELSDWNKFYNIVLSDKHLELQQLAFGLSSKMMIKSVYPRTLYMQGKISPVLSESDEQIIAQLITDRNRGKKIVGYFPTFRDLEEQNIQCIKCIEHLNHIAEDQGFLVITKLHFASHIDANISGFKNVINIHGESDVYDYLRYVDVLISDYSSIIFDFMLFDRPIVYYAFDIDYYTSKDRGFLFEYEDMCAGKVVYDANQLSDVLAYSLASKEEYLIEFAEKCANIKKVVYDNCTPEIQDLFVLWNTIRNLKEI